MARARSVTAPVLLALAAVMMLSTCGFSFVAPPTGARQQAIQTGSPLAAAAIVAAIPQPAHAAGMFDFGLTLPFVAFTFVLMMVTLNALWYAPVTAEVDDRNAKLLKTLSEATDMLTKADEIQVQYTEGIRAARENASAKVGEYRAAVEKAVNAQLATATAERDRKTEEVKARLEAEVKAKKAAAEPLIIARKNEILKKSLVSLGI